jgi:hypothetical protein
VKNRSTFLKADSEKGFWAFVLSQSDWLFCNIAQTAIGILAAIIIALIIGGLLYFFIAG